MAPKQELADKISGIDELLAARDGMVQEMFGDGDLNSDETIKHLYESVMQLVRIDHSDPVDATLVAAYHTDGPLNLDEDIKKRITELSFNLELDGMAGVLGFLQQDQPEVAEAVLRRGSLRSEPKRWVNNMIDHTFAGHVKMIQDPDILTEEPFEVLSTTAAVANLAVAYAALSGERSIAQNLKLSILGLIADTTKKHAVGYASDALLHDAADKGGQAMHDLFDALDEDAKPVLNSYLITNQLALATFTLDRIIKDPVRYRQLYQTALRAAQKAPFIDMTKPRNDEDEVEISAEQVQDQATAELIDLKPMELDWEVLPTGELTAAAEEIVAGIQKAGKEVTIDLERLKTLEEIRELWGKGDCYYAKGQLNKRHTVKRDGDEQADEYILLILQDKDDKGTLIEHAIAESPIAGPHAMYIFRQDVNPQVSWRQVMSVDKPTARTLGARRVKHTTASTSESMTNKACYLMVCQPEEFRRLAFSGQRIKMPAEVVTLDTDIVEQN